MQSFALPHIIDFEWDEANKYKSLRKHDVACEEAEQVFGNRPLIILDDEKHSALERRYHAFGKTSEDRKLLVSFTLCGSKIRIISARPMKKIERTWYETEDA